MLGLEITVQSTGHRHSSIIGRTVVAFVAHHWVSKQCSFGPASELASREQHIWVFKNANREAEESPASAVMVGRGLVPETPYGILSLTVGVAGNVVAGEG